MVDRGDKITVLILAGKAQDCRFPLIACEMSTNQTYITGREGISSRVTVNGKTCMLQ